MTEIYIAGASSRARTTKEYLEKLNLGSHARAFLVSPEMDDNPDFAEGIPVLKISDDSKLDTSLKVYIGTRGVNHQKLTDELISIGFSRDNIIPVTPDLDIELRNEYVRKAFKDQGKDFIKIDSFLVEIVTEMTNTAKSKLFIAKTVFDGPFSKDVPLKKYEYILQAGTELSDIKLTDASYFDNECGGDAAGRVAAGDPCSISDKNRQFCELTAMYWIWKNSDADVVGLEHWRRRFLLPENWAEVMMSEGIDVILPVPLCVMPSLEDNFTDRHLPEIWDATMESIKSIHPEDALPAAKYFKENNLYSPCNMLIARKEVFDDYSAWLFPVLFDLNERIGIVDDKYQNRYPGFVSERLLNYYFDIRRSDLKIAYSDKSFLS